MKITIPFFFLFLIVTSCSKNIDYSAEHIKQTTGRYLYNENEVIDIYYENNDLFIKWKGLSRKPVVLDENTFFVADMYKKLRFVQQPETKESYLGVVSEDDDSKVTYDFRKIATDFKTPRMYLNDGEYDKATAGYLELQKQDSTKIHITESEINVIGYKLMRKGNYDNAIKALKLNVALYPESDNVYDSLASAYLKINDSLQAYRNYKMAYELNTGNKEAKEFIEIYEKK